jgi:hypothetical protein
VVVVMYVASWLLAPVLLLADPRELFEAEGSLEKTGAMQSTQNEVPRVGEITPPARLPERERPLAPRRGDEGDEAPPLRATEDADLVSKLDEIRACARDVALERTVPLADVAGGALELRWTVVPTGEVSDAEVVALEPTDADVMLCAKRKMATWRFAAPPADRAVRLSTRVSLGEGGPARAPPRR